MNGEQLKLKGIERVKTNSKEWCEWAVSEIKRLSSIYSVVSADMFRASCSICNRPCPHPNAIGAAFNTAARAGLIVRNGYKRTELPQGHNRIIMTWRKNAEMDTRAIA